MEIIDTIRLSVAAYADTIIWVVIGILSFMFLVIIHELWHFLTAKKAWVKVLEFGVWIPPKAMTLWTDASWTEYTLNWIPLGGFVRLKGEDPADTEDFNAPDSFISAKLYRKIIILLGGIFVNLVFAWLVLTWLFATGTQPFMVIPQSHPAAELNSYLIPTVQKLAKEWLYTPTNEVTILEVASWSLASKAWFVSWDIITRIDSTPVNSVTLTDVLQQKVWQSFEVWYTHNNQPTTTTIVCPEDTCVLWVAIDIPSLREVSIQFPLTQAAWVAFDEMITQARLSFEVLGKFGKSIVTFNRKWLNESVQNFSWPIWAMRIFVDLTDRDNIDQFFMFVALISLALWVFNLLPIPALDWWRLLWVLIQTIFRLPKEKYFIIEWYINAVFFFLLIGLWLFIAARDLSRFWGVVIPFIG